MLKIIFRQIRILVIVLMRTDSLATSVEATGYALLALAACAPALAASCEHDARGAARWLAARRGPGGGFVATQVPTATHRPGADSPATGHAESAVASCVIHITPYRDPDKLT